MNNPLFGTSGGTQSATVQPWLQMLLQRWWGHGRRLIGCLRVAEAQQTRQVGHLDEAVPSEIGVSSLALYRVPGIKILSGKGPVCDTKR